MKKLDNFTFAKTINEELQDDFISSFETNQILTELLNKKIDNLQKINNIYNALVNFALITIHFIKKKIIIIFLL